MRTPYAPSPQQWAAISAPLAPAVVVAGAGSGKTTLMAARVVYLVLTGQVRPEEVLGLTFTTKAASELRQRIRDALRTAGALDEPTPADDQDGDQDDDQDDDQPKGKKGRASDDDDDDADADDDDDDKEMRGRGALAQARLREQDRIGAILGHRAAANNPALAVQLACETRMSRSEAIKVLKGQTGGGNDRNDDRSDNRHARRDRADRNANLGAGGAEITGKQAVSQSWTAAFERAGIKTR